MSQLDRFVGMLLHSQGEAFVIEITAQELKSPVVLYRSNADWPTTGILLTTCDVPQQEALRAFFGSRGAEPLVESAHEATTTLHYPLESKAIGRLQMQDANANRIAELVAVHWICICHSPFSPLTQFYSDHGGSACL